MHFSIFIAVLLPISLAQVQNVTNNNVTNDNQTSKDLYVIKTVVYEVGILTDARNDTDELNETREHIDVSFYNTSSDGILDFSNIPVPIQTNVSGITITGVLPANFSTFGANSSGLPVVPDKQVTVTQNISTTDPDKGSRIISNLPQILGLQP